MTADNATPAIIAYLRARDARDALEGYLYGGDSRSGTPYEGVSYRDLHEALQVAHEEARRCFARLRSSQMVAAA